MVKGRFSYRRTLEFLSQGRLYFKSSVKCVSIAYDTVGTPSAGVRRFVGEYVPQILYKNPSVSVFTFRNEGHIPSLKVFHGDGSRILIDCEGKRSERILQELSAVAGKPDSQVKRELAKEEPNLANFGDQRKGQFCICEVPGQVPCPRVTPLTGVHHKWQEGNN